ncbi:MAG: hypothetical protein ACQEP1_02165 [Nanobdellota archaeon]
MRKKGVIGIGTLIVFISGILAASIGAGVILHTQRSLQSDALSTGREAREAIGMDLKLERVKGEVSKKAIEELSLLVKVGPSSRSLKLEDLMIAVHSPRTSTTLSYSEDRYFTNKDRELKGEINHSEKPLLTDLDGDLEEDSVRVKNDTRLRFNLSEKGLVDVEIPRINETGVSINDVFSIEKDGTRFGKMNISGSTEEAHILKGMETTILPKKKGEGIYNVEYAMESDNQEEGYLKHGDMIKIHLETEDRIPEADYIKLTFYTPEGKPLTKRTNIPPLTSKMVTLFP